MSDPDYSDGSEDESEQEMDHSDPPQTPKSNFNRTMFSNDHYPDGSIKKIEYHNFLTYDSATCIPGPNLNVIIGSNGSGKSTIICGICIAVGGCPRILGRSERITDYIKYNCDEGYVEITIADSQIHGGELRIRAVLSKYTPNLQYMLNGKQTNVSNIRQLVHDYNIQIENPCTFLAQDKVKSFSEQNSTELLINTEKAGSTKLFELHNQILEKKKEEMLLETNQKGLESKLQAIENELTNIEPKVNNYLKRQKLQSRMRVLKKKKAIMVFDEKNERYQEASEGLQTLQKALVSEEKKAKKLTELRRAGIEKSNALSDEMDHLLRDMSAQREIIRKNAVSDFYTSGVDQAKSDLHQVRIRATQWHLKLDRKKQELEQAEVLKEEKRQECQGYEIAKKEYINKRGEINGRIQNVEERMFDNDNEKRKIEELKNELFVAKRQNDQLVRERLNQLNVSGKRSASQAFQYFHAHRTDFKGPIFVPGIHAVVQGSGTRLRQVMNAVGAKEWGMVIFSCKADEQLMHSKVEQLNSTVITQEQVDRYQNRLNAKLPAQLRQLGFECLMSEIITGPDPVKLHFLQSNSVDHILIGGDLVDDNYDEIGDRLKNTEFKVFITNNNRIEISVSRYTGNVIKERKNLRLTSNVLGSMHNRGYIQIPQDRINSLDERLEGLAKTKRGFENEMRECEGDRAKIKDVFSDWEKKKRISQNADAQYQMKETEYETHKASVIDVKAAEATYEVQREKYLKLTLRMAEDAVEATEALRALIVRRECGHKMSLELLESIHETLEKLDAAESAVKNMRLDLLTQEEDIRKERSEFDRAKQDLIQSCGIPTTDKDTLGDKHLEIFKELNQIFDEENIPKDREELDRQMADEDVRLQMANSNTEGSARDVRRRDELKVEQAELLTNKTKERELRNNFDAELGQMVDNWLVPLTELIEKISDNFGRFFLEMGCTGEIQLSKPENKLDVNKYGIDILVRFRETEKLRRLDNQSQSGGERSVSTMLYLLALQELCPVPFRCVDEINQGMDPTNERKVFEIMVNTLSKNGNLAKTQYFLLTPKLLHGLKYNEKVTVQIVHNSPTLGEDTKDWDHATFLEMLPAA